MLTIKYNQSTIALSNWKHELETLVMAHQFVEDKSIEQPILTTASETVIGEAEISKYVEELRAFQEAWFACACK